MQVNWTEYFTLAFANIENVTLDFDGRDATVTISDLEYIRAVLGLLADSSASVIGEYSVLFSNLYTVDSQLSEPLFYPNG